MNNGYTELAKMLKNLSKGETCIRQNNAITGFNHNTQ